MVDTLKCAVTFGEYARLINDVEWSGDEWRFQACSQFFAKVDTWH